MSIHIHETREHFLSRLVEELAEYASTLPAGTWISTSRLLEEIATTCQDATLLANAGMSSHLIP